MRQATNTVLMIEPVRFFSNPETADDNAFQHLGSGSLEAQQHKALLEFNGVVDALTEAGVNVLRYKDKLENNTPDSIYPNNWFSTHEESVLILYPMKAPNRRLERRQDIIEELRKRYSKVIDLSFYEDQGKFLESTGSMVLDRLKRTIYASISSRTHRELIAQVAHKLGYDVMSFASFDRSGKQIYHTNLMLSIGTTYAVVCLEALRDKDQRHDLRALLEQSGRTIVEISLEQLDNFCGNILELQGHEPILLMSQRAYDAFLPEQRAVLSRSLQLVAHNIEYIEQVGGGGIRCMVAEVF